MTPNILRSRIRVYLADTGVGRTSTSRIFSDGEINRAAINARDKLFSMIQEHSTLTVCRMGKTVNGTTGQPIPSDFWKLECGIRSGAAAFDPNGYVPYQPISYGGSLVNQNLDCIFAEGGLFLGTAATAVYWARPTSDLTATGVPGGLDLTDFPDAFYNCLATMAAIDLSKKEPARASRAPFLQKIWISQIKTLR